LDGELPAPATANFVAHVDQCAVCREAIEQQQWIDGLLRSDDAARLDGTSIRSFRVPRRRRKAFVAAVAATIAVALAPWAMQRFYQPSNRPARPEVTQDGDLARDRTSGSPSVPLSELPRPPVATFVSSGTTIAMPVESPSSEVTIMRLYPTMGTRPRNLSTSQLSEESLGDKL